MEYSIRKIRSEIEQLRVLHLNEMLFPADHPAPMVDGSVLWWLCREVATGDIVGFCGLKESELYGKTGYLERSGVLEAHRGKGLQKLMIAARLRECRKRKYKAVNTLTQNNPASANNLISCGFRVFTPADPWGDVTSTYWTLKLKKET